MSVLMCELRTCSVLQKNLQTNPCLLSSHQRTWLLFLNIYCVCFVFGTWCLFWITTTVSVHPSIPSPLFCWMIVRLACTMLTLPQWFQNETSSYDLEDLLSKVRSLCGRVRHLPCQCALDRHCQSLMASHAMTMLRSILSHLAASAESTAATTESVLLFLLLQLMLLKSSEVLELTIVLKPKWLYRCNTNRQGVVRKAELVPHSLLFLVLLNFCVWHLFGAVTIFRTPLAGMYIHIRHRS